MVEDPYPHDVDIHLYSFARSLVIEKWGEEYFEYFDSIVNQESGWVIYDAHYKDGKSSAHGLGGFLDMTWETVGCEKTDDPYVQIRCTTLYIEKRYGDPEAAWKFHIENNWY